MSAGSFWRSPSIGTITSPRRVVEARRHSRRLAEVAPELDELQVVIDCCQAEEAGMRRVFATVVDDHDLVGPPECRERGNQRVVQRLDVVLLVVNGDDDGDRHPTDRVGGGAGRRRPRRSGRHPCRCGTPRLFPEA